MATYFIGELSRREILRMSAILGVTSVVSTKFAFAQAALQLTPGQILGPFYPVKPFDRNADLTKVPGRVGRAEGKS
jgi:protocatechuate 3,4-dioxygenase, beta subunit